MPALIVRRLMVQRSWAKIPASSLIALRRSVGMRSVTDDGAPALNVTADTSPFHCWIRRQRPSVIAPPNLNECEPVTYDAENDSVYSVEKWSAGLFQAFAILPVAESTMLYSGGFTADTSGW